MSNNNTKTNHKATLENITNTSTGTTEYEAYGNMGVERRKLTGILAVKKNVTIYKWASRFIKPLAISASAIGFTFMIILLTNIELWSRGFYISLVIGLFIGAFFEFISTAFEGAISSKDVDKVTRFKKYFIIFVKTYAVIMHLVTAYSLPDYILGNKVITDTNEIKTLERKLARLEKGDNSVYLDEIEGLEDDIKAKKLEKTPELIANSLSIHKAKREDSLKRIADIDTSIADMKDKISKINKKIKLADKNRDDEITELESKINTLKDENKAKTIAGSKNSTIGLVIVLAILLVIIEITGTLFSVLHNLEIINGVGKEVAMTEEVKSRLYSNKVAFRERNNNIRAFEVRDSIEENKRAVEMAEYETRVKSHNLKLREIAITKEVELENSNLELQAKLQDLDIFRNQKTIEAIDNKINQVKQIANFNQSVINPKKINTSHSIGFRDTLSKVDVVKALYDNGNLKIGDKATPKGEIINTRSESDTYRATTSELMENGILEYKSGYGYFITGDYNQALQIIS